MIRSHTSSRRAQRGAVLYVALILLILLALIGVAGMQVSSLQERMSANYYSSHLAFENAEAFARKTERAMDAAVNDLDDVYPVDDASCGTFDPQEWAENDVPAGNFEFRRTRQIDRCTLGGDLTAANDPANRNTNQTFQITAYRRDRDTNASAEAVVDTVFIP